MNPKDAYEQFGFDLIPSGSRYKMLCPFVPENTASFVIYEDLSFHCFGCGAHGTYRDFLTRIGEDGDSAYMFKSPDTIEEKTFLDINKLKKQLDTELYLLLDEDSFEKKNKAWKAFDEIWLDLRFENDLNLLGTALFIRKKFAKIMKNLKEKA